ncbi:hypothetical protein [Streptomyces sp. NPDC056160]|uniref:hypothetical protein n=1 Tax=Streptomyces sp. NPDC056160 TaxID=3345731 RepID=UPI0035D89545
MPTPYGTRGGMAFGAEELRVLRRALAVALHLRPARAEDVQDCLRLAESLDEAMREGARLRAFLVADLARYRDALPGTAVGYLALLEEALGAGYRPGCDDLAALRALRGNPAAAALLHRCGPRAAAPAVPTAPVPASRGPREPLGLYDTPGARHPFGAARALVTVPGARARQGGGPGKVPAKRPAPKPGERPAPARPAPAPPGPAPAPGGGKPVRRPVPTPGEVFPRRKPAPPSPGPEQRLAARLAAV